MKLTKALMFIPISEEEVEVDFTRLVESYYFHNDRSVTYRESTLDFLIGSGERWYITSNTQNIFNKRYVTIKCPYCGKEMKAGIPYKCENCNSRIYIDTEEQSFQAPNKPFQPVGEQKKSLSKNVVKWDKISKFHDWLEKLIDDNKHEFFTSFWDEYKEKYGTLHKIWPILASGCNLPYSEGIYLCYWIDDDGNPVLDELEYIAQPLPAFRDEYGNIINIEYWLNAEIQGVEND